MQDAGTPDSGVCKTSGMFAAGDTMPARFNADLVDMLIVAEGVE